MSSEELYNRLAFLGISDFVAELSDISTDGTSNPKLWSIRLGLANREYTAVGPKFSTGSDIPQVLRVAGDPYS